MEENSLDVQAVVFQRYLQVVKHIVMIQGYTYRKHFKSGLVVSFPSVVLAPIFKGRIGHKADDKADLFYVFPHGKTTDSVVVYIDMYVGRLEVDLMHKTGRVIKLDRFADSTMDWRMFMDTIFAKMAKYIAEEKK